MNRPKSLGRMLWLPVWCAVICALFLFNISQRSRNRDLSQRIQLQSEFIEAQEKISQLEPMKKWILEQLARRWELGNETTIQVLQNHWSTLVCDDLEPTRNGVKIFTTCEKPMQVVLNVSRMPEDPDAEPLETYKFALDVVPNVWNKFGFNTSFGDVPVTSVINGEPEIEGELPNFRARGKRSPLNSVLYVGNPEPISDGIWLESKPYKYLDYVPQAKLKGRVMIDFSFRFADNGETEQTTDQPIADE